MANYDASLALDRKLTEEETMELKILLVPYFHASGGDNEAGPEDINDFLDYAFAMVNNQKTVEYVVQELVGMDMEFCNATVAQKVGGELSAFLQNLLEASNPKKGGKIASLKSTSEKGNALTMSGALGASREGGRNKNQNEQKKEPKGDKRGEKRKDTRKGERDNNRRGRGRDERGGRGGRATHKEAFDRLTDNDRRGRKDDRRRNSGDRGRGRRDDDRGRCGRDNRRDGGRFGGRNDRMSGNRRHRDDPEESWPEEGRGRGGRGRGRGGYEGGPKRRRYDDYYDDGYGHGYGGYHDYGYGGRGGYGRGGRGRGRFSGRGRGRGREEGDGAANATSDAPNDGGNDPQVSAADAANHPSPLVQANYSGGRGYGGRGRFGYGRGRGGRGGRGGRAHVVSMIQSKTWVRKKPEDAANAEAKSVDAPPPAE